jgi:NADH-quinone oxidoreductase subunit H
MPAFLEPLLSSQFIVSAIVLFVVVHVILITVAYLIYFERKISAYIQDRIGPNRVGFDFGLPFLKFLKGCLGLGQPLADGLKFLLKEDYTPERVDKVMFTLAPALIIIPALIGFAIIPWGGTWDGYLPIIGQVTDGPVQIAGAAVNVGIVYLLAVAALGVYGVTIGGWASNNKFSFLGGLRATAQMISYEIPLGLALLATLLVAGSFMPEGIVRWQVNNGWLMASMPLAALLFYVCSLAEANRAPFDNAEAEQELVGGYHTEYSSMRFALFFLAEYSHMITSSAFFTLLFLGGYHLPLVPWLQPEDTSFLGVLLKFGVFFGKVVLLICFMMVIRWTIPRLRYDQIMMMGWQGLIPISLFVVVVQSVMVYMGWTGTLPLLAANLAMAVVILAVIPLLPKSDPNQRTALYGSRFAPMPGERVRTAPTDPMAREDRPAESLAGSSVAR